MIVGATGSAKSTTWKMLKAAVTSLRKDNISGFEAAKVILSLLFVHRKLAITYAITITR